MAILIGIVAAILILALAIVFYLANGARIPDARLEGSVAKKPREVQEHRVSGIN
jgi:hypothetical protein